MERVILEQSLLKRYFIKLISGLVSGFVGFALTVIAPNALGSATFGQFSYIQQFFNQVVTFLDGGVSTAFFTKLSARPNRVGLIRFLFFFSVIVFLVIFAAVFSAQLIGVTSLIFPDTPINFIYFGALLGFLLWFSQVCIKVSDAYLLTVSVESLKVVYKLLSLGLLALLILLTNFNLTIYFYFHFISLFFFITAIIFISVKKGVIVKDVWFSRLDYRLLLREFYLYVYPLFTFNSLAIVISIFDIWLLRYISGPIQTGFYAIAYAISALSILFTSAITQVISRDFSNSFARNNINNIKKLYQNYVPMLYTISAYFGVLLAFHSEQILNIFYDVEFREAYFVLIVMSFYPLHQTFGQLNTSVFLSTEKTRMYKNIGIFSILIGLLMSFTFVYKLEMGAIGFAWKMVLGQLIGVNIQLYFISSLLRLAFIDYLKFQISTLLFFFIIAYIGSSIDILINSIFYKFIFEFVFYTIISILSVIIFPSIFGLKRNFLKNFFYNITKNSK